MSRADCESALPSSSAFEQGAKFAAHRKLPTLREYALIDPERLSLDLLRSEGDSENASKRWVMHPIDAGGQVEWDSAGLQLPLEALYEDVALPLDSQGHAGTEVGEG